jgi:hypothetical protein
MMGIANIQLKSELISTLVILPYLAAHTYIYLYIYAVWNYTHTRVRRSIALPAINQEHEASVPKSQLWRTGERPRLELFWHRYER